jgi:hypothetical protein
MAQHIRHFGVPHLVLPPSSGALVLPGALAVLAMITALLCWLIHWS